MQNLFSLSTKSEARSDGLSRAEKLSVFYHDLFDFPLSLSELIRWTPGSLAQSHFEKEVSVTRKDGYYFCEGKEGTVYKRILRARISSKKMKIAERAGRILSFVPGIKVVAVTGSLAMKNSTDESDIDLMTITKNGSLWTTRAFAYVVIHAFGFQTRKPNDLHQKDKLCLNVWLDDGDLAWPKKDRNVYSAHEIGQILPLINKDLTYEKFLNENKWILKYWPNSVERKYIGNSTSYIGKSKPRYTTYNILFTWLEKFLFLLQYYHMKSKITREVVTPTRALFHPQDWGKVVLNRLTS